MTACGGVSSNLRESKKSPDTLFVYAQKLSEKKLYVQALEAFQEFKSLYPLHRFIKKADLKVADIYFLQKNYVEAEYAYSLFRELYPRHPRNDYVSFQLGLSYFYQVPKVVERDLATAVPAVKTFRRLISQYPRSPYVGPSKKHIRTLLDRMAEKEWRILEFYFKSKKYGVSLRRVKSFLKRHPRYKRKDEGLYVGSVAAFKLKKMKLSKKYYSRLLKEGKDKKIIEKAKKVLSYDR